MPIYRNGRLEEVFWTYGYSPVFDDDGRIGGTLVVCTETTTRVLAERRSRFAAGRLAEAASLATNAGARIEACGRSSVRLRAGTCVCAVLPGGQRGPPRLLRSIGAARRCLSSALTRHAVETSRRSPTPARPERCLRRMSRVASGWPEPVSNIFLAPIGAGADRPTRVRGLRVEPAAGRSTSTIASTSLQDCKATRSPTRRRASRHYHVRAVAESERNNLLEQAPVATALMTGPRHVFQLANPLFLQIVGRRDIVGQAYLDNLPGAAGECDARHPRSRLLAPASRSRPMKCLIPLDPRLHGGVITEHCFFKVQPRPPMRNAGGRGLRHDGRGR